MGLKFPNNKVFRKALRHHAIENGYNYYYLHNGSKRIMVYCFNRCSCVKKKTKFVKCTCCSENKCNFKVCPVKIRDEETFQIRSLNVVHNYGHKHQNNKVTTLYFAEKYLDDWRENPNWDLKAFIKRVNVTPRVFLTSLINILVTFGDFIIILNYF